MVNKCDIILLSMEKKMEIGEKKKIKLHPISGQGEVFEVEVTYVDPTKQIDEIADSKIIMAQKTALVQARRAKLGDFVDTRPRVNYQGKTYTYSETQQTISEKQVESGSVIVTNPNGEEYAISTQEKFDSKYIPVEGGFAPIDSPKPFRVSNGNYCFKTRWGEEIVLQGSLFCVADPDHVYSITDNAFENTYKQVKTAENGRTMK